MGTGWFNEFKPYALTEARKRQAAEKVAALRKKGQYVEPVVIEGRDIVKTFWGKSWCANLESYSEYQNLLPRGVNEVRDGMVLDLQIDPGEVRSLVQGNEICRVRITIQPVAQPVWEALLSEVAGKIGSIVELLSGQMSPAVMGSLSRRGRGLFPSPREIHLSCSCPDWASMCKHVAATLHGVGARLDVQPDLLFRLRKADPAELVAGASRGLAEQTPAAAAEQTETTSTPSADRPAGSKADSGPARRKATSMKTPSEPIPVTRLPKVPGFKHYHMTLDELFALELTKAELDEWVGEGYLIRTDQQDVYYITPRAEMLLERKQQG